MYWLIQGAPGVGKTATAHAIAQVNRRPLFAINFEDIDYTAENLGRLFRRAEIWGGIVLLDEVDVYLTRRSAHDVRASILVSCMFPLTALTIPLSYANSP